jgi:F0F1-type ATP synthase gamma subunit
MNNYVNIDKQIIKITSQHVKTIKKVVTNRQKQNRIVTTSKNRLCGNTRNKVVNIVHQMIKQRQTNGKQNVR